MHQLAVDTEDEARTQNALRDAQDAIAAALQSAGVTDHAESFAHKVNQPLAAIVASAHACSQWLTADPPNIERARMAAERIIRDATAAAELVGRLRTSVTLGRPVELKGTNGRD